MMHMELEILRICSVKVKSDYFTKAILHLVFQA